MAPPFGVTWELLPHTAAKHEILRLYLSAWFPILGIGTARDLYYFDGFSGPGEYTSGEPGSPLIALDAASKVSHSLPSSVHFVFSELDGPRANHLSQLLSNTPRPSHFLVDVRSEVPFDAVISEYLGELEAMEDTPPLFVFIDPFGWTGFPMKLVRRILKLPRAEVLINFMYEEINRFIAREGQDANFDDLFGCNDWVQIIGERDPRRRNQLLWQLYDTQLRSLGGAKYVRSFEMRNDSDLVDYYLFYGTGHIRGLEKMKEAMWRVDPSGRFRFSDATNPSQIALFGDRPDFALLERLVVERFAGPPVRYGDVRDFVVCETPYIESHCKKVLHDKEMADYPSLRVSEAQHGRRRGAFNDPNLLLEFIDAPSQLPMSFGV